MWGRLVDAGELVADRLLGRKAHGYCLQPDVGRAGQSWQYATTAEAPVLGETAKAEHLDAGHAKDIEYRQHIAIGGVRIGREDEIGLNLFAQAGLGEICELRCRDCSAVPSDRAICVHSDRVANRIADQGGWASAKLRHREVDGEHMDRSAYASENHDVDQPKHADHRDDRHARDRLAIIIRRADWLMASRAASNEGHRRPMPGTSRCQ